MKDPLKEKFSRLKKNIKNMGSFVLAYSGGVDSAFLLKAGYDVLGKKVLAVTARSETYPDAELREAKAIAKIIGARHKVIRTEELNNHDFISNPPNRCYYCKKELFSKLDHIAKEENIKWICDGTNKDDLKDVRPGRQAAKEFKVLSPLLDAGLTKEDIRALSRDMGLSTWDKPSLACLSSRIPYGEKITKENLVRIEEAEEFISLLGFRSFRVRSHGVLARIEVEQSDIKKITQKDIRVKVINKLKSLGFIYITLDLHGYRSGSMNEALYLPLI
ncbi:MAG: ATP-dependent sacrificial sulfur transferase LarE [bacterium]|nr:ATP-dependent sacrificial sulfur transferase LarE [bacterium]